MSELPRPEVRLTRSSAPLPPATDPERPATAQHRYVLLAIVAVGLLLAGTSAGDPPLPPEPVDATLLVRAESLTVTQGGILVLPLELTNVGRAVQVTAVQSYAEPVVEDVVVQAPQQVSADGQRRFVALLAPDCRLLRQGSPISFRATVQLRVGRGAATRDLMADLAAVQGVRDQVRGLCRGR